MIITLIYVETNNREGCYCETLHYIYRVADDLFPEELALYMIKTE